MPFKKVGNNRYKSPSGKIYTKAEKDAYYRRKRRKKKK